jgi:hypothetical protein
LGFKAVIMSKKPVPWYARAKQYVGKTEYDTGFNRFMSGFWKLVGLPHYKTIVGSSFAWCGLFVVMALAGTDMNFIKNGAGAKNWDKFGVAIDWKADGIPQGAIVRLNHNHKCDSSSGNHVAMADGDCAAVDLLKSGATINLYGGNQSNSAKVSTYDVKEICSVRWPADYAKAEKVLKSVNCSGKKSGRESTR